MQGLRELDQQVCPSVPHTRTVALPVCVGLPWLLGCLGLGEPERPAHADRPCGCPWSTHTPPVTRTLYIGVTAYVWTLVEGGKSFRLFDLFCIMPVPCFVFFLPRIRIVPGFFLFFEKWKHCAWLVGVHVSSIWLWTRICISALER